MRVGGKWNLLKPLLNESNSNQSQVIRRVLHEARHESELLLYRPVRRGPKPKGWMPLSEVDITIRTNTGNSVPKVDVLRVLGMLIESNGCNGRTINKIITKTENMIRLINRVSNRRGEIIEAQETAQVARLSSSPAGREILDVLGLNPMLVAEQRHQLSDAQRARIQTSPFPRNVHPQHNVGRRRARAMPHSMAARPGSLPLPSITRNSIVNSVSFKDSTPSRAEQAAIALALLDDGRSHSTCPDCGSASSFDHMLWLCPALREPNQVTEEEWSSAITSSELRQLPGCPESPRCGGEARTPRPHVGAARMLL
ncbi:hypothetical protein HPB47_022161 [Ixodes persulcatus]|uniref:Uncharacterized protein n=1 Tax=Ixodes persulcatus TaxID=34615 RepID=A0AC60QBH5_IXOPE|nr:hypothetical protein HPB47_022161 [Ixodes persulcatus]